tara:strand:- start:266 stop:1081 length:816 start_codon:yes stop_codon:yes gene_type:complete
MKKIIYDLGASKGENLDYYLLKSDLVICVEANPSNCEKIINKYKKEILNKRIIVENCIIGVDENLSYNDFYIHNNNYLLGQFPIPEDDNLEYFKKIRVSYKNINEIFKKYGPAHYIKIDLENYDETILQKIFDEKIFFDYLSYEIKNIDNLNLFSKYFDNLAFKIVDGHNIKYNYSNHKINLKNYKLKFKFDPNSAGPFGNDIEGKWINKNDFYNLLKFKLKYSGWYDIHFSKIDKSEDISNLNRIIRFEKNNMFKVKIKKKIERILKKFS